MIVGQIDNNLEAKIGIELFAHGKLNRVACIIDTGFNGFLALPMPIVDGFELQLGVVQSGITADGRAGYFDTVKVQIMWFGETVDLQAQVLDEALIGTRLLRGLRFDADWLSGGEVRLEKLK